MGVREMIDDLMMLHKSSADCEWSGYHLCKCDLAQAIRALVIYELKEGRV